MNTLEITPIPSLDGSYKQHLICGLSAAQITRLLGFTPNVTDDPGKVVNSWAFAGNGHQCAIWDWKGSQRFNEFSAFGPADMLREIFGANLKPAL